MGLGRHGAHWLDFPVRLQTRLGTPVVTVDLAGTGVAGDVRLPCDVATIAREVLTRCPSGPLRLVGVSLGGMVALAAAASDPGRVRATVVINTSSADVAAPWARLRLLTVFVARVGRPLDREGALAQVLVTDPVAGEAAAVAWRQIAREMPVAVETVLRHTAAAARFRLPAPVAHVTVVVGRGDRLVDSRCSDAVAKRLGAPLVVHETAGHALHVDAPDWLADVIAS